MSLFLCCPHTRVGSHGLTESEGSPALEDIEDLVIDDAHEGVGVEVHEHEV